MELKRRYKQTEVGVIPEDWDVVRFADIFEFRNGVNADKHAYGKGIPFINVLEVITKTHLRKSDIPGRVLLSKGLVYSFAVRRGDIVFNRTSETQEEVGLASVYLDDETVVFGGFVIRGRPAHEAIDTIYSGYALRAPAIRVQIIARGQGAIRANVGQGDLRQIFAPLPPLPEQRAIAAALSDVDALIAALDKLIAKKRDIKQAAIQQLLTGKQRLPGFRGKAGYKQTELGVIPEDWRIIEIKKITRDHKQGFYTKDRYVENGVRLVRITDLMNPLIDYAAMPMLRISKGDFELYKIMIGDFLFARSGAIGRYGIVYEEVEAIFGSYIIRFRFDSNELVNEYFGFLYETEVVWKQLLSITQGSSNININASNIKSIKIPYPSLREQCAIAAILSDMDAEIAALEARRDKTRALKQGMMQELLTGRIRLI